MTPKADWLNDMYWLGTRNERATTIEWLKRMGHHSAAEALRKQMEDWEAERIKALAAAGAPPAETQLRDLP
jgi:hypothetical protein